MERSITRCILLVTLVSIGIYTTQVLAQNQAISEEQRKLAMELAPDELRVERIEIINGVVRLTGQSSSMKSVQSYASTLLRNGVVGSHLYYLSNDNGRFRIDIGTAPANAD